MLMSFALSATATQKADYSSYYKSAGRFRRFARTLITCTRVEGVGRDRESPAPAWPIRAVDTTRDMKMKS